MKRKYYKWKVKLIHLKEIGNSLNWIGCTLLFIIACDNSSTMSSTAPSYNFKRPSAIHSLPKELQEISGLSVFASGELAAVQDELGYIFKIDAQSGKVLDKIKFHKKGDYEGLVLTQNTAYVVRSDGNLYEIKNLGRGNQEREKITLFDKEDFDIEGLTYDRSLDRLLIVLKEYETDTKAVFEYHIPSASFNPKPVWLLDVNYFAEKLTELDIKTIQPFAPSGIAVHPITGDWYIISADAYLLIVVKPNGMIAAIHPLNKDIFRQAEGITFDEAGNLYIASEGAGKKAKIVKFEIQ